MHAQHQIGVKCDLGDLDRGMVVGVRKATVTQLSTLDTPGEQKSISGQHGLLKPQADGVQKHWAALLSAKNQNLCGPWCYLNL